MLNNFSFTFCLSVDGIHFQPSFVIPSEKKRNCPNLTPQHIAAAANAEHSISTAIAPCESLLAVRFTVSR